ncbi:hypothetical protein P0D72_41210, partial [Paraburkholderia sediminicola]|uniref:hypothetical protein n=1 Tax=Paraburkholderia sediminicola TaxID=458836 RepID=UPI0038B6EAEC
MEIAFCLCPIEGSLRIRRLCLQLVGDCCNSVTDTSRSGDKAVVRNAFGFPRSRQLPRRRL